MTRCGLGNLLLLVVTVVALILLVAPVSAETVTLQQGSSRGSIHRGSESPLTTQAGVSEALFAASDCLLDKRGRELLATNDESPEGIAALKAVANIKWFTLAHCDLAIQHQFAGDALAGLARTLSYTDHTADADRFVRQYKTVARRHEAIEAKLERLGKEFEDVFPLVVAPPLNRIKGENYDRAYFAKRYQGSSDFVAVTAQMLAQAEELMELSKAVEREARALLQSLGAGGGPDWAPDSLRRTEVSSQRNTSVRNFDENGRPTNIIIGTHLSGNRYLNLDLQDKFRVDFELQQYSNNSINEKGELNNTNVTYGHGSLPGDIVQPCGNHGGTMYCPMPLFMRFKQEGRLRHLFEGLGYGNSVEPDWEKQGPDAVRGTWNIVPVDYTLPEVWEAQSEYLRKVGGLYADRPDINNIRISWEPTNSWGTEVDETREVKVEFLTERGHTPSGRNAFRDRMKKKFGTIEQLNAAWRSSYESFEDIDVSAFRRVFPTDRKGTSPLFYEWEMHRRLIFAEWLRHCYASLRAGGCRQPIAVELPVPQHVEIQDALEPYPLAHCGDIICAHDFSMTDSRDILLESLQHYFPEKSIGSMEYYWNQPEAQFNQKESVSAAAGRRNFWRSAAHGTSIFGVFLWADQGPYPGWLSSTNENLMDYYTDYSLLRVSAGVVQVQNAKLDALADVFLKTVPVSKAIAIYWPTASTINAMPLDVLTHNREDPYRGIIPTIHWMLYGRGYSYRYVFEQAVLDGKEDLSEISVLIMPYAAWLPEEVSSLLTSWVKKGGTLICAGPVGAETPYGFKDGRTMREVFGQDFAMAHVDGTQWQISSPSNYTHRKVVEATFGKGRVVMTTSGFGLFHGEGNRLFWQALDSSVTRDAWCTTRDRGKITEPNVDLAMREDRSGNRYLIVTNLDVRSPAEFTLGLKGHYARIVDLGVCGSVSFKPQIRGANTYVKLRLESGEGTVLQLKSFTKPSGDLDTESMRTEVAWLAGLAQEPVGDIGSLTRAELASRYNELLGRGPLAHFEPVKPGRVIVNAPFAEDMRLAASDAQFSSLTIPEGVFGKARVDKGSLLLDTPGSGISYAGDGFFQSNWGGSMGLVINKPFTVELDFKAKDEKSGGTLFDIWYGYTGHFRIRITEGGGLQVRHSTDWWYEPPAFELTTPPCGVTDGQWHRITVTVPNVKDRAKGVAIYLDGKLLSSQTEPTTYGSYTEDGPLRPGQMKGRPVVEGKVMQWAVGCHIDRVNGSSCSYIAAERLDTPLGRYRNLVVMQGVSENANTVRQESSPE